MAAKLEESQNSSDDVVDTIVSRAYRSLQKHHAAITRAQWLHEAESAESSGAPRTSAAIVRYTVGQDVDPEDRLRTWADDAKDALARGAVATARAIISHCLESFPHKRALWTQAVELEKKHGTPTTLDKVLEAACNKLPRAEIFWLLRAKERWLAGDVNLAREILASAFEANPDSEAVWLAAAKLEQENGEVIRARILFERARERAPTARVFMKSAVLEREQREYSAALKLIDTGVAKFPKFAKLYMIGGQICADDVEPHDTTQLDRAREYFQRGLKECPDNATLWILASRLEERAWSFDSDMGHSGVARVNGANGADKAAGATIKARSLLEVARMQKRKSPELWLEAIRLERRTGNAKLADSLMAKALQECPASGILLAEHIRTAPRVEQKARSSNAIKRSPDDAHIITAVAGLFASEKKVSKARKWFDRAVVLDPDLGDSWVYYYAFECSLVPVNSTFTDPQNGNTAEPDTSQREQVKQRCVVADPHHGGLWTTVTKDIANRGKNVGDLLEIAATKVLNAV
jgi:pre-mRNA-processing factor 6